MNKKYRVRLSKEEREQLLQLVSTGIGPARQIRRAQILLKVDEGEQGPQWSGEAIGAAYNVSEITISEVRKAYVERGLEGALQRKKPDRVYERRLDGDAEAHLIAVACSEPPEGAARWSLRLLQEKLVDLEIVDSVSHETIRQTLKKTNLSLG